MLTVWNLFYSHALVLQDHASNIVIHLVIKLA